MQSGLFQLNIKDFAKGLSIAVIAIVLGALQQALTAHGFDFASYDWGGILQLALGTGMSYIVKNYLSDSNGAVFGKIG